MICPACSQDVRPYQDMMGRGVFQDKCPRPECGATIPKAEQLQPQSKLHSVKTSNGNGKVPEDILERVFGVNGSPQGTVSETTSIIVPPKTTNTADQLVVQAQQRLKTVTEEIERLESLRDEAGTLQRLIDAAEKPRRRAKR